MEVTIPRLEHERCSSPPDPKGTAASSSASLSLYCGWRRPLLAKIKTLNALPVYATSCTCHRQAGGESVHASSVGGDARVVPNVFGVDVSERQRGQGVRLSGDADAVLSVAEFAAVLQPAEGMRSLAAAFDGARDHRRVAQR